MTSGAPPALPVPLAGVVKYISQHPKTPMGELLEPYRKYEAHLRRAFAQDPGSELLKDPLVNVLPLFTEDIPDIKIRARKLENETKAEKSKYIMPLPAELRRPDGTAAVVQSFKEFQHNFNVFSESSLVEIDWSNVVAAGSSVVNCLLPVPDEYKRSKRGLREFYHEKFCPASDVDLFLYGLTEEQAVEKIKDIETRVRDALLTETTVVRTKHAITICSQHPTRHIQIVLRIYKSVSEILTGFDIDCSGAAYDGRQVYCTPRALQSYMTQINHIDLTRRSPSYENRLSKYSHRGFEIYWPDLDRSRVDPTIFERSFQRTLGLARLLVLERLPTSSSRDRYRDTRRRERGRPPLDNSFRGFNALAGNIKDDCEDEVADWFNGEEDSNYHTFTIPYGPKFHAKKIEKLCYTRDLLLNAEWNQPEDREVYLHRHPALFGRFEDVIHDCCGFCPVPQTDEEKKVAEEEGRIFVSGSISFIKDDPGRQQIGSFNPLTDDDWIEMAYVGDTARLCQAIVDGDVERVTDWLSRDSADPNTRDYTGRTPLHLAVLSSTPEVVRALVNAGARLVARLADGRTALHLASARGDVEIVKILLEKSIANEAEWEEKLDQNRRNETATKKQEGETASEVLDEEDEPDGEFVDKDESDEFVDKDESDDEAQSMATGSFVNVGKEAEPLDDFVLEDNEEEPDYYDVNVLAWDLPCTALHFAILEGHVEVVKTLVQEYGADVLLPVKFISQQKKPTGALLNLLLAMALPVEKAKEMVKTLLSLGATAAQADMNGVTALRRLVDENAQSMVESVLKTDPAGARAAINHLDFPNGFFYSLRSAVAPLQVAIQHGNLALVSKLLDHGAAPHVDFETWLKSARQAASMVHRLHTFEENQKLYDASMRQPLLDALQSPNPAAARELLDRGANPNIVTPCSHQRMQEPTSVFVGESALDVTNKHLETLRKYEGGTMEAATRPNLPEGIDAYLSNFEEGTYRHWAVSKAVEALRSRHRAGLRRQAETNTTVTSSSSGVKEKMDAIQDAIRTLEEVKHALLAKGAKTFLEIYPEYKDRVDTSATQHGPAATMRMKDAPYSSPFTVRNVNDVTKARHDAYLRLFNAAWDGDLETIKTLTLTSWDDAKEEAPLKIAVHDENRDSPFSLAFYRCHYSVAKAVLEIAQAQYAPDEKPKTRYKMQPTEQYSDDDSEYSDDGSARSDGSGPRIYCEILDDQFTIDNVGQVSMKVNSRTKPQEMVGWTSPLSGVILKNDMQGLKFLIDIGEWLRAQKCDPDDEVSRIYTFPDDKYFHDAIRHGRVELLGEIIKRTGAWLPLKRLVENTGLELKTKPRYYQGLTVYGKKRKDWATAGHAVVTRQYGTEISPLLFAALAGRIESVEWFLSDTPLRHYLAFAKSKAARDDVELKHLAQAPGGFEAAISKWLKDQSELVLHAAIQAHPSKEAAESVSYLVKTQPALLDIKSTNDMTPLMLACRLGRLDFAKILIDAGADQTTRDQLRHNLLHAALHFSPSAEQLKPLLDLLDRQSLVPMLKERNKLAHGGRTPLHQYFAAAGAHGSRQKKAANTVIRMFKLLVDISPETAKQALRMLDGAGDTALHTLLANDADPSVVRAVIDFDLSLLFCENAVGRTPAEVAHDRYLTDMVRPAPLFSPSISHPWPSSSRQTGIPISYVASAPPGSFINKKSCDEPVEHEPKTIVAKNWRLCAEVMSRVGPAKRTLVSLHSANLVAKRLGKQQHPHACYKFHLAENADHDASTSNSSQSSESEDESAGRRDAGASLANKPKRQRRDIFSSRFWRLWRHDDAWDAWALPKHTNDENGDESESDDEGGSSKKDGTNDEDDDLFPLCDKCGERHYKSRVW